MQPKLIFVVGLLMPAAALAINCKGCTPLDEQTFDKLVNAFPVSVVKFDVAYPYGDKHDEFAKIALEAAELPNVFVGEVGIKDYGDKVCKLRVTMTRMIRCTLHVVNTKHLITHTIIVCL